MKYVGKQTDSEARPLFRMGLVSSPSRQRGIAILTAVAVAALVASIATFMAFRENLWLRQVENQHDLAQAQLVALSAVDFTRLLLLEDGRVSNVDNALEEWNVPITNLPVEQGSAGGSISDVQSRFCINNLVREGAISTPDVEVFKRLLGEVGLSSELAPAVVEWITPEGEASAANSTGTGDQYYLTLDSPRRVAHRTMFDLSELALVKGFDAEAVKRLTPFLVALPPGTKVNVNFAPPEVLRALIPSLDTATADLISRKARTQPFNTLDDFHKALPAKVVDQMTSDRVDDRIDVATHYFYSDVDAHFGRVNVSYRALIERLTNNVPPTVVWLRRR